GIHPVGRLAFFHNYSNIRNAIETAEKRTRGHEAKLLHKGLDLEPGLNIFIIGSLCGGTGSGMALDTAYSLRQNYGDQGAQIFGYLVISPQLYGNNSSQSANTYAALKELNHYSTPGNQFQAVYDPQNLVWVEENRAPFDYTYLISSETGGEYTILDQRKLCNVIAHKIGLEFSSELAPVMSGMRDNFLSHLIGWDQHPRRNSQGYLTFGLAAIYFPRDRIVQIALNRISLNLLEFWLNGKGQKPDVSLLLEQFMTGANWHQSLEAKDHFTYRLREASRDGKYSFTDRLKTWRNNQEKAINENSKKRDDRARLYQQLPKEFKQEFRKVQPGETESVRGEWITRLKQAQPKLTATLKEEIYQFLVGLLTPSNQNFSLRVSREWLEALLSELNNYQRELEEKIRQDKQFHTIEEVEKTWRNTQEEIDEIDQKFKLFGKKESKIQEEARGALQRVNKLIQENFELALHQEALKIVQQLQEYVQARSRELTNLSRTVDSLKNDYLEEESELKQLNFDEMSGEAIFNDEDIQQCCETLLPSEEARSRLVLVTDQITENLGEEKSLINLVEENYINEDSLQNSIYQAVDTLFGRRSSTVINSVIKRFLQNYRGSERSIRLNQILQQAAPLLKLNKADPHYVDDRAKSSRIIGFRDTDETEVQQFKDILYNDLAIPNSEIKPTQAEDEIIIVSEYAGFPLRLIEGLDQMRKHYVKATTSAKEFLHNDAQTTFTDIIPPDANTLEDLQDIFYPSLALQLLSPNAETGELQFTYYDQMRGYEKTASLSSIWEQALETLYRQTDLATTLQQNLEAVITEMKNQPQQWKEYYRPKFQQFVQYVDRIPDTNPNYPYRDTLLGIEGTLDTPYQEGVLERFRKRIEREIQP
ncbi:MAG: tubulin-like doman-containing protein, partial [Cyanobacteriota bacterium]